MRIAICDDEQVYINITREYCERYFEDKKINFSVDAYTDSEEFLANAEEYDVVLLDVNMPKVSGIDIKERIGDRNKKLRIIFISSYPDNMPEAFGERVMGFLVKPLKYDEFTVKMDKVLILAMNDDRAIMYETFKDARRIKLKDIMYIMAEGKYSRIFINDGSDILVIKGLNECEGELGKSFVRCHKSYIVNLAYVRLLKREITLRNGKELPVGRSVSDAVKQAYNRHILEEGIIWSL